MQADERTRIAVIGLGRMGGGLAARLTTDFDVVAHDLDPAALDRAARAGAEPAATAIDAVDGAAVVITSLPLPEHVIDVYGRVAPALGVDTIVVDTSTVDPETAGRVATLVGRHRFVACLLGKGPAQAATGDVPLFVGGPDDAIDELGGVFDRIGAGVHRLGTVEAASAFKLVSNLIGMTNLAVLAEGLAVCRRLGVPDAAFNAALADTGAWSFQAEVRLPWMQAGDFDARFATTLGLKDLRLAVDMAARAGVPTPVGAAGMARLADAVARGYGDDDVDAVLKVVDPPG